MNWNREFEESTESNFEIPESGIRNPEIKFRMTGIIIANLKSRFIGSVIADRSEAEIPIYREGIISEAKRSAIAGGIISGAKRSAIAGGIISVAPSYHL